MRVGLARNEEMGTTTERLCSIVDRGFIAVAEPLGHVHDALDEMIELMEGAIAKTVPPAPPTLRNQ